MKHYLSLLSFAVGLDSIHSLTSANKTAIQDIDFTSKIPPVPKGCKRYYFNKNGECNQKEAETYFDCLKKSNAYKKYSLWLNKTS